MYLNDDILILSKIDHKPLLFLTTSLQQKNQNDSDFSTEFFQHFFLSMFFAHALCKNNNIQRFLSRQAWRGRR